jgi:large subunit ribosomal protein L23
MKLTNVINKIIETEKTEGLKSSENVYVFDVTKKATKPAIAQSLKEHFNVDAISIKTMVMPGKKRRLPKTYRFKTTASFKKALVKLKSGQKIEL